MKWFGNTEAMTILPTSCTRPAKLFHLLQILHYLAVTLVNLHEMVREHRSHDDLAHVMHQAGHVVRLVLEPQDRPDDFPRQNGRADAVLPEFPPRKRHVLRQ